MIKDFTVWYFREIRSTPTLHGRRKDTLCFPPVLILGAWHHPTLFTQPHGWVARYPRSIFAHLSRFASQSLLSMGNGSFFHIDFLTWAGLVERAQFFRKQKYLITTFGLAILTILAPHPPFKSTRKIDSWRGSLYYIQDWLYVMMYCFTYI